MIRSRLAQRALPLLLAALATTALHAQFTEGFPNHNGLIITEQARNAFRHVVDSLHAALAHQPPAGPLRAPLQAPGVRLRFVDDSAVVARLRGDLDAGLPLHIVRNRYGALLTNEATPEALVIERNRYPVRDTGAAHAGWIVRPAFYSGRELRLDSIGAASIRRGSWRYSCNALRKGVAELTACFFYEAPQRPVLPERYARLVRYAQAIAPPGMRPFLPNPRSELPSVIDIESRIDSALGIPPQPPDSAIDVITTPQAELERLYNEQQAAYDTWRAIRTRQLTAAATEPVLRAFVAGQIRQAIGRNGWSCALEEAAQYCCEPNDVVELMRRGTSYSTCWEDPYVSHTVWLAIYAARALRWDVFTHALLISVNDSVEFNTMPQLKRVAFTREFESVGVHVGDLIIGSLLQTSENDAPSSALDVLYQGSALVNSSNAAAIKQTLLSMIMDSTLDHANRTRMFVLYGQMVWYNGHEAFAHTMASLPDMGIPKEDLIRYLQRLHTASRRRD